MLFSKKIQDMIHNKFTENLPLGKQNNEILKELSSCNEDERIILEFYYSTMPASDIGDYDFLLYKKFADFGLFLMENSQWKDLIPEDIFFNFVLHYRINNENIEDCRPFFYHSLCERINGKSMKEAALEVNIWCAEHVNYQSTDERTASPLTVLRSSYGRCGEESTLLVTALRSVGIPVRQVYTPRWAHCDSNHAWVEVWCDGAWYYLGACEPEPVLNRGWFNNASTRAMLVDGKAFLPVAGEEIITQVGQTLILNELSRYAQSRRFVVTVEDSVPIAGVTVHFEMLNGSEFFPIASIITDKEGHAGLTLGYGSIHIHAVKDSWFVEAVIDTGDTASITLDFSKAIKTETEYQADFNLRAPKDSMRNNIQLTEEQKELRRKVISSAEQKRKEYADSFYQKAKAEKLAVQFNCPDNVIDILKAAEGNFQEIYDFLSADFDGADKELQLQMLESLLKKDYRDVQCSVLTEHFQESLKYKGKYPQEIFVKYIMCPRAHYEQLTKYRELISTVFDAQTKELFKEQPKRVWEYAIKYQMDSARHHERLFGTPAGILRSGFAGVIGQKVLFTAICRSLGVPSRINPIDLAAQYYENGVFKNVEDNSDEAGQNASLILVGDKDKWFYMSNWTIAILREGSYQTLELSDLPWIKGKLELSLEPGCYRLITSNRTTSGNQYARKYCFQLEAGKSKTLEISLRELEVSDLVTDIPLTPFKLYNTKNEAVLVGAADADKPAVLVWLEEGYEPTEHILNEFIQAQDVLNKMSCDIFFIVRDKNAWENELFKNACEAIRNATVYYSDFSDTAAAMARRMYVDQENLPLAVIIQGSSGIYACSGYNVGIVNLFIKIMKLKELAIK